MALVADMMPKEIVELSILKFYLFKIKFKIVLFGINYFTDKR